MVSNCCGAPVLDPGNTGEGLCCECHEHCTDVDEDDLSDNNEDEYS